MNDSGIIPTAISENRDDDDDDNLGTILFSDVDDSPPPPEPTFQTYAREPKRVPPGTPQTLTLRLVGSHPLWAHYLWNASKVFTEYLDEHKELCRDRTVLELGAGAALPSLVAAANGASKVVITDYPDKELIENIEYNAKNNLSDLYSSGHIVIQGYVWGTSPASLLSHLLSTSSDAVPPTFDLIILSDLLFNHSQHHAMLRTCRAVLTPRTGAVYVFYTHHRPHLAERDVRFFEIAARPENNEEGEEKGYGFCVERVLERRTGVMFAEDPGDEDVRATVHGWKLWLE